MNSYPSPIENCNLNDIKIKNRIREDDIYLNHDSILKNIRRGNCIFEKKNHSTTEYLLGRKGLIKFFDYQINGNKINNKESKIIWNSLSPVYMKKCEENKIKGIYVYTTEKANGENLQISYDKDLDSWLICSKNVTILLRNINDLQFYTESKDNMRYSYCNEFAKLWFEILDEKIIKKDLLDQFKEELDGFTLIGENVGDENHQHIKYYQGKDFQFYALVKNNSSKICEPIEKCKQFLDKYNLTMVNFSKSPLLETKEELEKFMKKIYLETLNKTVEEAGEGSVTYFSKCEDEEEEIIQLAKLKTFEYRFLRKLREKMKTLKRAQKDVNFILKKIKNECDEILGNEGDSLDFTDLLNFAKFVLNFVVKTSVFLNYENYYANFINLMKEMYELNKKGLNNENELNFLQTQKEKLNIQLQSLLDKLKEEKCENKQLIKDIDLNYDELNEKCEKNKFEIGRIYMFCNIGLIAGGKSTACKILQNELNFQIEEEMLNLIYISSDEIRNGLENQTDKKNNKKDEKKDKLTNQTAGLFENKIREFIINESNSKKFNFIIADKNFFSPPLIKLFSSMENFASAKNKIFEMICFIPRVNTSFSNLSLSMNYIIQSYYRLKNRKNHENVDFDLIGKERSIGLFLSFLTEFKTNKFCDLISKNIHLYGLKFSDEKKLEHENYQNLLGELEELLEKIKAVKYKQDFLVNEMRDEILEIFEEIEILFPEDSFDNNIENHLRDQIKSIIEKKLE